MAEFGRNPTLCSQDKECEICHLNSDINVHIIKVAALNQGTSMVAVPVFYSAGTSLWGANSETGLMVGF